MLRASLGEDRLRTEVSLAGTGVAAHTRLTTVTPPIGITVKHGRLTAIAKAAGIALARVTVRLKTRKPGPETFTTVATNTADPKGRASFGTHLVPSTTCEAVLVIRAHALTSGKV